MEEERVVWSRILDEPVHGTQNVLLGRLAHGILLIVRKDHHVLSLVAKMFGQVRRHIANIIDAPSQLATLPKIIDTN